MAPQAGLEPTLQMANFGHFTTNRTSKIYCISIAFSIASNTCEYVLSERS